MSSSPLPTPRLILASASQARRKMLDSAGLMFNVMPAALDEEKILQEMKSQNFSVQSMALKMAEEKALSIALKNPNALIIGSDQILKFEDRVISKSTTVRQAREKLLAMKGKSHTLVSAVCAVKDKEVLWSHVQEAQLRMRNFDEAFLERYCLKAGNDLLDCVGGYALEKTGAWLFENVQGDYFTVLGMPLLPLLGYLDKAGEYWR